MWLSAWGEVPKMTLFIAFLFAIFGNSYAAAVFIAVHWALRALRLRGIVF